MIVEFLAGFTVAGSAATAAFYVTRVKRTDLAELREKFELLRSELREDVATLRKQTFEKLDANREEVREHKHSARTVIEEHGTLIDRNTRAIENMFTGFNDKLNELKAEKSSLSMMLSNARRPNG